jgi:tetratricopeptide (TPR) repeat protein
MTVLSMSLWKARQWKTTKRLPGDSNAWFALGVAAVQAGRTEEAAYALVHAVELSPDDPDGALAAAQQLVLAGCHAEAEKIYRGTIAYAGERTDLRAGLIRLLLERGRDGAARQELQAAMLVDPSDRDLRSLAAEVCERLGELDGAIVHLEGLLEDLPEDPDLNRRLGQLLGRTGERARAINCLRRAVVRTDGDDLEAATQLGIELSRDGQHGEAIELLEKVAAKAPDLSSVHANLGMALLAAGYLEESVNASSRALELDYSSAQAHCGQGLAYQKMGRLVEAAKAFAATEQLAPQNPAGPLNLAVVLEAQGDREQARQALLRAAALAPEDKEIKEALERFMASSEAAGAEVPHAAPLEASISGEIKSFSLFDVLEFLRVQSKTGSLVIHSRHGAGIVRLVQGALTCASAPGTPRVGDVLLEAGTITRAQLNAALSKQRGLPEDAVDALGSILLNDNVIDRAQLQKLVFEQAITALGVMTSWSEGAFSFHPADGVEAPPVSFSVQQIVLELMRRRDESNEWSESPRN